MEAKVFERIRRSLLEKRQNLTDWLNTTPTQKGFGLPRAWGESAQRLSFFMGGPLAQP
jgi:hypothetical protein